MMQVPVERRAPREKESRMGVLLTLIALLWTSAFPVQTVAADGEILSIERIFADPALDGSAPRALRYSPDGGSVTYLKGRADESERYDLWAYDIADRKAQMLVDSGSLHTGDELLSEEEKSRRERQRLSGKGIMEYVWAEDSQALLFPLAGDVYRYDLASSAVSQLTSTPSFETDVRSSPKGRYVSFIRDQNIVVIDVAAGRERALTTTGGDAVKNGMAEFVAQEEMGRLTGYWWSPDERWIAFLQVDESPVDLVTRSEIYADRVDVIQQRYPAAGRPNVSLRLGIADVVSGETRWLELGDASDFYIPRVQWASNSELSYQWQSRDQQTLELRLFDLGTGSTRVLLTETSNTWVNLTDDLHFLTDGRYVWSSERSGFRHLYLYSVESGLLDQLTSGDWAVDALAAVDETRSQLFFTGRRDTPLERHLYSAPLGLWQEPERLTERSGMHAIEFAPDGSSYLDRFSSTSIPPQVSLHAQSGERIAWVEENRLEVSHPIFPYRAELIEPEFGHITAPQGHRLYYQIYKPRALEAGRRYPVIVYVYGGPGAQRVKNQWGNLFLQYLAQQGYVVFTVDNRGSEARGKVFEDALFKSMGSPEVDDQLTAVSFLKSMPFVDAERIGVYGHSYGGYMTLMSLMKAPEIFAAGVAGAPVTDWLLYDTHYTERYMGSPGENADAYRASSVFPYVEQLKDPLLLYHGMADDNVLFTHSTRLMKALQDARIPFELMTYPGKKHSMRGEATRVHLNKQIAAFFDRHLRGSALPSE
ncbi:MAG: S9 family peptidase [Congregibacter sp.]